MSSSICIACLSRLRIASTCSTSRSVLALPTAAPFSSSATTYNVLKKKSSGQQVTVKYRESRAARIKKKAREKPKTPAVGERRQQRKRIVLSNTNAFEVPGLTVLDKGNMTDSSNIGRMMALNGELLDQLRDAKAFKTTQNWSMFRQPSTLIRQETVELGKDIADVDASLNDQGFGVRSLHKLVVGEQATGKSIHLLQGMSMALLNGWIVVNIPEAQDFTNNTSAYTPAPRAEGIAASPIDQQYYNQPTLTAELLARIAGTNATTLASLKLVHTHPKTLPIAQKKNATLKDLALAGSSEPQIAPLVFEALWKELTVKSSDPKAQARPPVLVTVDSVDHWMGMSAYRSADFNVIHAHQLNLVRHFVNLLFPENPSIAFPNGGGILAATSGSNRPAVPSFRVLLRQLAALQAGQEPTDKDFPMPTPYSKQDQRVLNLLQAGQHTDLTTLSGISKFESKGLLEYFARSGILREAITDNFIGQQWSLSGSGIIGEITKLGRRVRV